MALAKIEGETAKMAWSELQRFFANGTALYVAPELDLVQVAFQMSEDNSAQVAHWLANKQLGQVRDSQALAWLGADQMMWTVVVKPWILVQPLTQN